MEETKKGSKQAKDNMEEIEDEEEEDHFNNEKLQCRFYRKDFPEENDLVVVSVLTPLLLISINKSFKYECRLKSLKYMRTEHM